MPFVIGYQGLAKYTNPEMAKLQVAAHWRQHNMCRSPEDIDNYVRAASERLYNIQNGDIWGAMILDMIAPAGRNMVQRNRGFSYHEEVKFEGKSDFLKDFYEGGKKKTPHF